MKNDIKYSRRQKLDYIIDNQPNVTAQFVNMTAVGMSNQDIQEWFTKIRQQQIDSIKESLEEI